MKRFRFRLERVLDYRKVVEGDRKRELLDAQDVVSVAEARDRELADAQLANEVASGKVMTVEELQAIGAYGARLREERFRQAERIAEAHKALEEAQQRYTEARKEVRVLESLRTKKQAQHAEAMMAHEMRNLDEQAVQRFGRERSDDERR